MHILWPAPKIGEGRVRVRGANLGKVFGGKPVPFRDQSLGSHGDQAVEETAVHRIRRRMNPNAPFGSDAWMAVTARLLGLDASLRPIGFPQKLVER
ncbi:hypothetical protein NITLEN_10110 [Nitrospira lenta]|uniref:Uncharacterized protein n=1 Tax=Nitrospira lenta TaxID=1436998 RepID=A0A330L050_9BACT|nr:hypothetical protein NITLEN_10110 [Nitrospira lenta]